MMRLNEIFRVNEAEGEGVDASAIQDLLQWWVDCDEKQPPPFDTTEADARNFVTGNAQSGLMDLQTDVPEDLDPDVLAAIEYAAEDVAGEGTYVSNYGPPSSVDAAKAKAIAGWAESRLKGKTTALHRMG